MALRNASGPAAKAAEKPATPAFEAPEGDEPPFETSAPAANEAPPAPSQSREVAVARTHAVATATANAFTSQVDSMKGAADFTYGNYKVFKGHNGEIVGSGDNKESLGRWARVTLLAWDDHYEISPGVDTPKAKDYVAYSKDGVTVDNVIGEENRNWNGKKVTDYVDFLHSEDYSQAGVRRFIDLEVAVLETDTGDVIGEIVQVTLSPSSLKSFDSYANGLKAKERAIAKGIPMKLPEDPFTFYLVREAAAKGSNKWTKVMVAEKLPAKL